MGLILRDSKLTEVQARGGVSFDGEEQARAAGTTVVTVTVTVELAIVRSVLGISEVIVAETVSLTVWVIWVVTVVEGAAAVTV